MENNWEQIERNIRRIKKMIAWKIQGQFIHGITPNSYKNLTPKKVEEIYNVDFGN